MSALCISGYMINCCLTVGAVRRQAPSEHMTPKDVVISAAPAEASLAQYMKGMSYHLNLCNVFFLESFYIMHTPRPFFEMYVFA